MWYKPSVTRYYGPNSVTTTLIKGCLLVVTLLTVLLIIHDLLYEPTLRPRIIVGLAGIILLFIALRLAVNQRPKIANWLLIGQFELLTAAVLLYWGLESMVGILTACFTILLPSILMHPRHILAVGSITFGIVLLTFFLHSNSIVNPTPYPIKQHSSVLDIIAYGTILSVFALVSWVSSHQFSKSLERAMKAEEIIRKQKDTLAAELKKESSRLRESQLIQIQQLYKFALIGQSAAATLHELSNHLSVLNLDIDDLKQQHTHSRALANAEESMSHINKMVKDVRLQLDSKSSDGIFSAGPILKKILHDMQPKFQEKHITLKHNLMPSIKSVRVYSEPTSLMQVVSILLNNALDACFGNGACTVTLSAKATKKELIITVSDNGPGVDVALIPKLFQPKVSKKSTGLGVGLYLAKHLIESQYRGKLTLINSSQGASFVITIPRK